MNVITAYALLRDARIKNAKDNKEDIVGETILWKQKKHTLHLQLTPNDGVNDLFILNYAGVPATLYTIF